MVDTFLIKIPQQGMCLINIFTIHVPQFFNHQYIEQDAHWATSLT